MIYGEFRDGFPRITLHLPLRDGGVRAIEFVVDSGFEGDLALAAGPLSGIDASYAGEYPFALADLTYRTRPVYQTLLNWHEEPRATEVIALEGHPLLGMGLLGGNVVQMEMTEGGEISVELL